MSTIQELLEQGEKALAGSSPSARLDAEVLLAHALRFERWKLLVEKEMVVATQDQLHYQSSINRRVAGEPVAYITTHKEFWGLPFQVDSSVLIPRPESELLVEHGVKTIVDRHDKGAGLLKILDLGAGSGALAISTVVELKKLGFNQVSCTAVDSSAEALEVARRNAQALNAEVLFECADWFTPETSAALKNKYNLILVNPPYVSHTEYVSPETRFEPKGALYSEDQGLKDTKQIISLLPNLLTPDGVCFCEVGAGKRSTLADLFVESELSYQILGDDSANDRFAVLKIWHLA